MQHQRSFIRLALLAALAAPASWAQAAPTAAEIDQLGKTLTPIGAEKGANKDGTIPAWDGGLCKPPAGYKPLSAKGGYPYVDPFAADKPLFSITAANVAQYTDKLSAGALELFRRNPATYRIDVYPTRRSACMPTFVYENTVARASKPRLESGGLGLSGAQAQVPFPIPKNGYEVMWNMQTAYTPPNQKGELVGHVWDSSGNHILGYINGLDTDRPYWDNKAAYTPEKDFGNTLVTYNRFPASAAGQAVMFTNHLRADQKDSVAWIYFPGQRRVRLAPEFKYDAVTNSTLLTLYDENGGFSGKMDKYDFKLVGKKEMFVQYNTYAMGQPIEKISMPRHPNPETTRWELHRVWVVDAQLKEGERHVQKRKVFYIDEDTWLISAYDGFDHSGKVHHHTDFSLMQLYDQQAMAGGFFQQVYDFSKSSWGWQHPLGKEGTGLVTVPPFPPNFFTPDGMTRLGIR